MLPLREGIERAADRFESKSVVFSRAMKSTMLVALCVQSEAKMSELVGHCTFWRSGS